MISRMALFHLYAKVRPLGLAFVWLIAAILASCITAQDQTSKGG